MTTVLWESVHIFYYDTDKDALILECLRPLMKELQQRDWVQNCYFIRHWQGGPHIRLHIASEPERFHASVLPYVQRKVGNYLQSHPSLRSFTEGDATQQHERRRHMSLLPLDYVALMPNNTFQTAPYDALALITGSPGMARLLEDFYIETNDLVFSMIERTQNHYEKRLNACFDLLVTLAASSSFLPLTKAYMSFRSHAEAYIVCEPSIEAPALRRQRFAHEYEQRKAQIRHRVERLLELLASEQLPEYLRSTLAVLHRYAQRALAGVLDGSVMLHDGKSQRSESVRTPPSSHFQWEASRFHTAVLENVAMEQLNADPEMLADRVVLNLLYLHLSRMGMVNEDRYILDYYIAETIEEMFHIDPVDVINRFRV